MRRTRVSNPERKAMRALREKGLLIREIQARFPRWATKTVSSHVAGIRAGRLVPEADKAAMRQLRREGLTLEAIHTRFPERAYSTIQHIVRGVCPERAPIRRDRKVCPLAALRLRDEHGLRFKDIGERFGVTAPAAFYAYRAAKGAQA